MTVLTPGNIKIVCNGDSWLARSMVSSPGISIGASQRGIMSFVTMLEPSFKHEVWSDAGDPYGRNFSGANFAVSGDSADNIMGRMAAALLRRPNAVVFDGGYNDASGVRSADAIAADIIAAARLAETQGSAFLYVSIWSPSPAVANWGAGSDARYKAANINRQVRNALANMRRCVYLDTNTLWADITAAVLAAAPKANYAQTDGVHPTARFCFYIARDLILPALRALFPQVSAGDILSQDDIYHATKNPYGMMTNATYASSNPFMRGTAVAAGTGVTGNVASGLTVERSAGLGALVASKNADGSMHEVITPPASGTDIWFNRWGNFAHGLAVGTWVQAFAKVSLSAWDAWVGAPVLECNDVDGSFTGFSALQDDPAGDDTGCLPTEAMTLYLATQPFQIVNAGNLRIRMTQRVRGGKSGTGNLDLYSMAARPVPDPRPFWGY